MDSSIKPPTLLSTSSATILSKSDRWFLLYAFLVHGKGSAVGGFGDVQDTDAYNASATSDNIVIVNNNVQNIKCFTNEVLATVVDGGVQNDARGAILQFYNALDEAYIGMDETPGDQAPTPSLTLVMLILMLKPWLERHSIKIFLVIMSFKRMSTQLACPWLNGPKVITLLLLPALGVMVTLCIM